MGVAARATKDIEAALNKMTTQRNLRNIVSPPSDRQHIDRFHDVAHEAGGIPVGCVGLCDAVTLGAAGQQTVLSGPRQHQLRLPLPKSMLAFVFSQLRLAPALAAVDGVTDACHAAITTKGDAAHR